MRTLSNLRNLDVNEVSRIMTLSLIPSYYSLKIFENHKRIIYNNILKYSLMVAGD